MAERYGPEPMMPDRCERLVCSRCGSTQHGGNRVRIGPCSYGQMSDADHGQDFSPRRGWVWAPALILALAVLVATLALVAQHRRPFHLGSPPPPSVVPTQ